MSSATLPEPVEDVQGDSRWMSLHNLYVSKAKEREPEVLFIGDSLIQQLVNFDIWHKMCVPLHCLNFGIGGDQTQHVLWRIKNGELDNISPKVIVLLVGTNNHGHTAEQVAEGIMEIVKTMTEMQPQAQIIVSGIPPRGEYHNPLRDKIAGVNRLVGEKVPGYQNAQYHEVDASLFVNPTNEAIHRHDMYDFLHLTRQGYQKLMEPLLEEVETLLKNFLTADKASISDVDN